MVVENQHHEVVVSGIIDWMVPGALEDGGSAKAGQRTTGLPVRESINCPWV
jgi:hypothetical protein